MSGFQDDSWKERLDEPAMSRLDEISYRADRYQTGPPRRDDMLWLIAEVERLTAELAEMSAYTEDNEL